MDKQISNNTEREESALRSIRMAIIAEYQATAVEVFRSHVELTDEEFAEFMRVTESGTVVFTQPTQAALEEDTKSECPRFKKGRKFGSVQWYKKTQVVGTALALLSSYSSYLRYCDSRENEEARTAKRLDTAATSFGNLSAKEQAEFLARLQAMMK